MVAIWAETGSTDACADGCNVILQRAEHIHSETSGRVEKLLMRSTIMGTPPHSAGHMAGFEARVHSTKAAGRESRGTLCKKESSVSAAVARSWWLHLPQVGHVAKKGNH